MKFAVQVTPLNLHLFPPELRITWNLKRKFLKTYSTGQGKKSLPKIFQMLYLAGSLWHKTGRTAARFWAYNSAEKLWAFPGPQKTHTWSLGVPDRMMGL